MQVIGKSIHTLAVELENRRNAVHDVEIEMEKQRNLLEITKESYNEAKRNERNTLKRYADFTDNLKARGLYDEVKKEWETNVIHYYE